MNEKTSTRFLQNRFSFLIIALPLLVLILYAYIIETTKEHNLVLLLFLIVLLISLGFYNRLSGKPIVSQGYYLLISLIMDLFFMYLILTIFSSFNITFLEYFLQLFLVAILIYFISFLIQYLLIWMFKSLHKLSFELKYNEDAKLTPRVIERKLDIKDFSFPVYNRYLKINALWAVIPFAFLPLSLDFLVQITDPVMIMEQMVSLFLAVVFISLPLSLIQYRNYKDQLEFYLEPKEIVNGIEDNFKITKAFSDDLMSFLKVSLIVSLSFKTFDIIQLLYTLETASLEILLLTLFLLLVLYKVLIELIFFIQINHNYLNEHEGFLKFLRKVKYFLNSVYKRHTNFIQCYENWLETKKNNTREKKPFIPYYIFLEVIYIAIDIFVFIILMTYIFGVVPVILLIALAFTAYFLILIGSFQLMIVICIFSFSLSFLAFKHTKRKFTEQKLKNGRKIIPLTNFF